MEANDEILLHLLPFLLFLHACECSEEEKSCVQNLKDEEEKNVYETKMGSKQAKVTKNEYIKKRTEEEEEDYVVASIRELKGKGMEKQSLRVE